MPEVAEQDESAIGTPGGDTMDDVFAGEDNKVENKTYQRGESAKKSKEISQKVSVVPVEESKSPAVNMSEEMRETMKQEPGDSDKADASKTGDDQGIPSAVKEDKLNEDIFAIPAKEEIDKKEMKIESSRDSLNVDRMDRSVSDKNGEVIMVNGVHEDIPLTKTQANSKPDLVTVKEGYSLVAPKQKVEFAKVDSDDTVINGTCSSLKEDNTGQCKNGYEQEQRLSDQISNLLPVEVDHKGRNFNIFESKSTTKQNSREKTETSSTSATQVDDSNRKLKTSLELSDIPLGFNRPEVRNDSNLIRPEVAQERKPEKTGKFPAGRPQAPQNTALSENGGKTDVATQSQNIKTSREEEDDSPWVLQLPKGGDLGLRKRGQQKRNSNSNKRTEHRQENKQSEVKDKQAVVLPTVTIDQRDKLRVDRNCEHALTELSESGEENTKECEPSRTTRESDLSGLSPLSPLSPLMEDQESNRKFLHPSGAQAAKVKRNKSFMARGFSKMFGSKRKYKVDKEQKDTAQSSESDNRMAHEEFDLRENHNTEKKEKKKKKKKSSGENKDEQTDEHGADNKSSRKLGGLFSRGKKKDKHSH